MNHRGFTDSYTLPLVSEAPDATVASRLIAPSAQPGVTVSYWPWIGGALLAVVLAARFWRELRVKRGATRAENRKLRTALEESHRVIANFANSRVRFVSSIAQEIKAPLATMLIHANLVVASSEDPAIVTRYARSFADDTQHLSDLVESFLRLALPLAQEDISNHVPLAFHDIVVEAVRHCQSLASTRQISVVPMLAEVAAEAPVEVLGDARLLQAMVDNLVRNAVAAAPRNSRVDLHVRVDGSKITLAVRDHGARLGSDQLGSDQLESVFGGFLNAPDPPRLSVGTGLGLAVAKRVAEHHRGTISMRNLPEGGCEFEVQLPRWSPQPDSGEATRRMRALPPMPAGSDE